MKSKDYLDREALGIRVRQVWIEWAKTQPDPKPSWLLPWEEMLEADKEVDRMIGETIAGEAWDEADEEIEAVQERLEAQRQTAKTLLSLVDVWKARAESAERINLRSMALSVVGLTDSE
jgi:3-hydroxyacyl-CoA dehydrogenase